VDDAVRTEVLRRLDFIQGHLEGIRRMLARDEPCARLLLQAYAVRRAIQTIELRLLERHLLDCLRAGTRDERARQMHTDVVRLLVHRRERGVGPPKALDISEKVLVRGR
jgi:DNA-binding FrmR family transcriptional regulator